MSEEIRAKLATLAGLGVISRNSARHSVETGKTIRQRGDALGVDYVLDGTVRWAGRPGRDVYGHSEAQGAGYLTLLNDYCTL